MGSLEDLERRVSVLEARASATEADHLAAAQKLNALLGTQDSILGILRDQGRLLEQHSVTLAEHSARFDSLEGKMDMVVAWIERRP